MVVRRSSSMYFFYFFPSHHGTVSQGSDKLTADCDFLYGDKFGSI